MSYRKLMWIGLLLASPYSALAQSFEYPLQLGNQWTYRDARGPAARTWSVEATALEDFGGKRYTRLEGFPQGTLWLRQAPDGKIFSWSPDLALESLWLDFGAREGVEFSSSVDRCSPIARIASYSERYAGPVGRF